MHITENVVLAPTVDESFPESLDEDDPMESAASKPARVKACIRKKVLQFGF